MKARRRHELKENVLAQELGKLREFLSKYGNWIFGALAAAVIVLLVARHYVGRGQTRYYEDQRRLEEIQRDPALDPAQRLAKLEGVLDTIENPVLAAEATVWAGDLCLDEQLTALHSSDAAKAGVQAGRAERYYKQAISKYPEAKLFAAKAHLGLGLLAENAGDFAAAIEHYDTVMRLVNQGFPVAREAERRKRMCREGAWTQPARFATTRPSGPSTSTAPATRP